jgi:hypothetical protein
MQVCAWGCSSMVDISNFAGSSDLCNQHVSPANPPQHLHPPEPQAQALAPPVPLFTPGTIVLGMYFVALHTVSAPSSSFVSHASVSQRASWFRQRSATLQVCSRRCLQQAVRRAVQWLPSFTGSSRLLQKPFCQCARTRQPRLRARQLRDSAKVLI